MLYRCTGITLEIALLIGISYVDLRNCAMEEPYCDWASPKACRHRHLTMTSQSTVQMTIKPDRPPSGSRIPLHAIDRALAGFLPLNLFFKPSSTGPTQLQDFATSLQDVLDRLPLIAGSIYDVEDAHGVKSKELIDDGRGADLIRVDSPVAWPDSFDHPDVSPRPLIVNCDDDQPLLMVKFTKFTCGTLAMGISISHMLVDLASCVDLIKEWARVSRGDSKSDPLAISSWERHPLAPCSPYWLEDSAKDWRLTDTATSPPRPRALMMSNFFFTWESLRKLKDICTPTDPNEWVSTGDCVAAVVWRAIVVARKALLKPGRDVHLSVAADGRRHAKMEPGVSKYFGNLVTPFAVALSPSSLLEGSLASVALACRPALIEQLTEATCANLLALFDNVKRRANTGPPESAVSSWTKYPLVGDALDFGGGAPCWASTLQTHAGVIVVVPQKDGYLASLTIEAEWESSLHTADELLMYAKRM
ncbi:transferase [Gautieria morchelliformis]|nr:transferase [Gautieria morchelliformis]